MSILRQLLVVAIIVGAAYALWDARDLGLLRLVGLEEAEPGADSATPDTPARRTCPSFLSHGRDSGHV